MADKEPRTIASGTGALTPPEFCHADSTGAGLTAQDTRPNGLACLVSVRIPLRTLNPLNHREHWTVRSHRVRYERDVTGWCLKARKKPPLPVVILLTREAARAMDTDGLAASFKGVRDEVAAWLGLDDADPRVTWEYAQVKAKGFNVLIEIRGR